MRRLIAVATAGLLVLGPAVGASEAQDDLLAGVNRHRIALDRRPVRADPGMMRRSQRHAEQMAEAGDLFHSQLSLPEGATWAGETIGTGGNIRSVVRAWLHSPEHRWIVLHRAQIGGAGVGPVAEAGCGSSSRSQIWGPDPCAIYCCSVRFAQNGSIPHLRRIGGEAVCDRRRG
jgi:Cysteine-rich secretory protein family